MMVRQFIKGVIRMVRDKSGTGSKRCDCCGRFCRETGSALYETAYKCDVCSIKYYDRSSIDLSFTSGVRPYQRREEKQIKKERVSNRINGSYATVVEHGRQVFNKLRKVDNQ